MQNRAASPPKQRAVRLEDYLRRSLASNPGFQTTLRGFAPALIAFSEGFDVRVLLGLLIISAFCFGG